MRSQSKGIMTLAIAVLTGGFTVGATEFNFDVAHTEILFKARHMGINTVTGRFDAFSGSFDVDPKNVTATHGSMVIQTKSINTNNPKRDAHLQSDDFFNAEKYPEIKFVSKSVRNVNLADSTCDLVGDLTIRDVTKEIVLKVKGGGIMNDGWGNERAAFSATGKINRFDYGLKWNKLIEAGGVVVGPEVVLDLSFEGVHPLSNPADKAGSAAKSEKPKK